MAAGQTARDAEAFEKAYTSVRSTGDIQLTLPPVPKDPPPPDWLISFSKFMDSVFDSIGGGLAWLFNLIPGPRPFQVVMWLLLAGLAIYLLVLASRRYNFGRGWRREPVAVEVEEDWGVDREAGRQWLEEAEALAAEGRFAEAVHRLLLRSIEDLSARRPQLSLPSLTGRELAASPLIPERARALFASIVAAVEPSLFGGRALGEPQWNDARDAYREFVLAPAWRK